MGNFLESLSQAMFVGIMLVGRLGVVYSILGYRRGPASPRGCRPPGPPGSTLITIITIYIYIYVYILCVLLLLLLLYVLLLVLVVLVLPLLLLL